MHVFLMMVSISTKVKCEGHYCVVPCAVPSDQLHLFLLYFNQINDYTELTLSVLQTHASVGDLDQLHTENSSK